MSISQDSGAVIVCREVFDEDSRPSNEEVLDYAKRLGIDPDAEPHLLDLARSGLMAPLPKGWSPCLDEATGAWYYYQASTRTTTWEHPLDARHRELVERARAKAAPRRMSLDDDSKTTAKELESHEEATLPKDTSQTKLPTSTTKIPTKLAPLARKPLLEPIIRRRDSLNDRTSRKTTPIDPTKNENPLSNDSSATSSLMTDRAARDYTNIVFQDPKFYETPRLLDSPEREIRLKEIVKRSESMSPRYEKDWEQLSSKFSSDENVIDIDKLSANALVSSECRTSIEKFDKEKHPKNFNQQKELTLTGGGSMFLKSNRSRDNTPCREQGKFEDFQTAATTETTNFFGNLIGERPKSILREKPADDEDRPTDEERKSVRFDLEKDTKDIVFTFSTFDDDVEDNPPLNSDSESDDCENVESKNRSSLFSSLRRVDSKPIESVLSGIGWLGDRDYVDDEKNYVDDESARKTDGSSSIEDREKNQKLISDNVDKKSEDPTFPVKRSDVDSDTRDVKNNENDAKDEENGKLKKNSATKIVEKTLKKTQLVGRRFVVENVSENEHLSQSSSRTELSDVEKDYLPTKKFGNIKNIDIFSKSETESTGEKNSPQEDSKSSMLDEIRRSKELMMENMKLTDQRVKRDKQKERDEVYHMVKLRHDLEAVSQDRGNRLIQRNSENTKFALNKHQERELSSFQRDLEINLERSKREFQSKYDDEKSRLENDLKDKLKLLKTDLARKEEEEIKNLIDEMNEMRTVNLAKVRNELEICYEKERQDILENLKIELDQRKRELLDLRNQEMEKLQTEHDMGMIDEKIVLLNEHEITKEHNEKIEAMKRDLEKEFDDLRNELRIQQREKVTKITDDHEKCLAEILRDFRVDEGVARKVYKQRLDEIRSDFSRDTDKEVKKQAERVSRQETVDYEKIRCEKRLLEDKYKTLKDKYSKLKNDVRLAVERRSKRKEGNTTTSETEKSTSARTRTERTDSSDQKASPTNTRSNSIANIGFEKTQPGPGQSINHQHGHSLTEDSEIGPRSSTGFPRSGVAHVGSAGINDCSSRSSTKFESDDATTASETVNSNVLKNKRKSFARRTTTSVKQSHNNNNNVNGPDNPVENIRKQLEKLEDLGDQLPSNESAYTLRYPFQDKAPANASSELEFFRHRIHVERDSVKRAREALRVQRSAFQSRQRAWKQKSARATLEQLVQEERELSDMEVSLHRTRSLLGEKVIYLRHLEQSLERVANAKRSETECLPLKNDEITLSDMSSASSGFSSTDLGTDTFIDRPDHYQESTEIIASLENLNSEIREIWGVLNKRQDNNIPPPPTLMYSDLGWLPFQHLTTQSSNVQGFGTPNIQSNILSQLTAAHPPTTTTQNIIAQYGPNSGFTTSVGTIERGASSLIERTRHMRDWLRQARIESTDLINPGQATL